MVYDDVHLDDLAALLLFYLVGFMLLSTTFSVLGLLFIAKDIDNPASGKWKIKFTSFDDACMEIEQIQNMAMQARARIKTMSKKTKSSNNSSRSIKPLIIDSI
jgi:hypothetical protein